MMVSTAKA